MGRFGTRLKGRFESTVLLNMGIVDCSSTEELCELIEEHAEQLDTINVATAFRKLLQSPRDGVPRGVVDRALQALEAAALRRMPEMEARNVADMLHIIAKSRYSPWDPALVPKLEGQAVAVVGTFSAQGVTNTLWAFATMGREPGARLRCSLEERIQMVSTDLWSQDIINIRWAYSHLGLSLPRSIRVW